MMKELLKFDPKKAITGNSIPSKTLCQQVLTYLQTFFKVFLMICYQQVIFQIILADITPVFKKNDPLKKEN